jgi:endoglucanase
MRRPAIESVRLLSLATLVAGELGAQLPASFTPVDPFEQVKTMGRGVNIIGYDPIWENFEKARFKERHFDWVQPIWKALVP